MVCEFSRYITTWVRKTEERASKTSSEILSRRRNILRLQWHSPLCMVSFATLHLSRPAWCASLYRQAFLAMLVRKTKAGQPRLHVGVSEFLRTVQGVCEVARAVISARNRLST